MTGQVTGSEIFVYGSYVISSLVLLGLVVWVFIQANSTKRRLKMLEEAQKTKSEK